MGFFDSKNKVFYMGASNFLFDHGIFDFEQGALDSEHTWNEKLEILA